MARTANSYQQMMIMQLVSQLRRMGYTDSQIKMALMGRKPTKRRVPPSGNTRAAVALMSMRSNRRRNNRRASRPKRNTRRPLRYLM